MLFHLDLAEAAAMQAKGHGPVRSLTLDSGRRHRHPPEVSDAGSAAQDAA